MKSIYYSYSIERQILAVFFSKKKLLRKIINQQILSPDYFYLDYHKYIFKKVIGCVEKFNKFKVTKSILLDIIKDEFGEDKKTIQLYKRVVDKIYKLSPEPYSLRYRILTLKELYKKRKTYVAIDSVVGHMNDNNFEGAEERLEELHKFYTEGEGFDFDDNEGEVAEELNKNIKEYKLKASRPKDEHCIPTGIGWLQKQLGGSHRGEFYIILAFTKVGKSLLLMELGYQAARRGYVVVHFTIEMSKEKATNRFYSRLSKIPVDRFKNVDLTGRDYEILKKKIKTFKSAGGKYHIVSFPRGCNTKQIEGKLYKLKEKYGRIDLVTVDYLNDMQPNVNTKRSGKDWDMLGEISWELSVLSRSFDSGVGQGIPLWSANQATKQSEYKRVLKIKDFAFSPLPYQHADATVYIAQTMEDEANDMRRIGFICSRDGADVTGYDLLFGETKKCCMINSVKRKAEVLNIREDDAKGK